MSPALVRYFPKQDYEVLTVTSAAAAYELLGHRPVDVIISDERRLRQQGLAVTKELQPGLADHIDRPQPSYMFRIGDRVVRRGAQSEGPGTITQVLPDGVVRVLWDLSVSSSMHTCDRLSLGTDTSSDTA
jgi:hypothetical protein